MRPVVPALTLAVLLSACAKTPATEDGTGGAMGTGGKPGTGGSPGTGGAMGTGGKPGTGGSLGTGGSSLPPATVACTDVSSAVATVTGQWGTTSIPVDNNPNKSYYLIANWWSKFSNETETVDGLGFTLSNPNNDSSSNYNPLGFPSIFLGAYQGKPGKGSNMPKQVSALTSVPTIFRTNATSLDYSNFNATYDVWFSNSSSGVSGSCPAAFLMVWLYKPSKQQPRGGLKLSGQTVGNAPGSWNVWYDDGKSTPSCQAPCVSYVSVQPISELQFDLNDFIQDAVDNKWGVTQSQYLSIVFAGTEVWGGGNGFQIKQFCADVK